MRKLYHEVIHNVGYLRSFKKHDIISIKVMVVLRILLVYFSWGTRASEVMVWKVFWGQWFHICRAELGPSGRTGYHSDAPAWRPLVQNTWIIVPGFILLRNYLELFTGPFWIYQVLQRHFWVMMLIKLMALCICWAPWTLPSAFLLMISFNCHWELWGWKHRSDSHLVVDEEFRGFKWLAWCLLVNVDLLLPEFQCVSQDKEEWLNSASGPGTIVSVHRGCSSGVFSWVILSLGDTDDVIRTWGVSLASSGQSPGCC